MADSVYTIDIEVDDTSFQDYLKSVDDFQKRLKNSASLLQQATTPPDTKGAFQPQEDALKSLLTTTTQLNTAQNTRNTNEHEQGQLVRQTSQDLTNTSGQDVFGQGKGLARSLIGGLGSTQQLPTGLANLTLGTVDQNLSSETDLRNPSHDLGTQANPLQTWNAIYNQYDPTKKNGTTAGNATDSASKAANLRAFGGDTTTGTQGDTHTLDLSPLKQLLGTLPPYPAQAHELQSLALYRDGEINRNSSTLNAREDTRSHRTDTNAKSAVSTSQTDVKTTDDLDRTATALTQAARSLTAAGSTLANVLYMPALTGDTTHSEDLTNTARRNLHQLDKRSDSYIYRSEVQRQPANQDLSTQRTSQSNTSERTAHAGSNPRERKDAASYRDTITDTINGLSLNNLSEKWLLNQALTSTQEQPPQQNSTGSSIASPFPEHVRFSAPIEGVGADLLGSTRPPARPHVTQALQDVAMGNSPEGGDPISGTNDTSQHRDFGENLKNCPESLENSTQFPLRRLSSTITRNASSTENYPNRTDDKATDTNRLTSTGPSTTYSGLSHTEFETADSQHSGPPFYGSLVPGERDSSILGSLPFPDQRQSRFDIAPTPTAGLGTLQPQLEVPNTRNTNDSGNDAFSRWAPSPNNNDPHGYIDAFARRMDGHSDQNSSSFNADQIASAIMQAVSRLGEGHASYGNASNNVMTSQPTVVEIHNSTGADVTVSNQRMSTVL